MASRVFVAVFIGLFAAACGSDSSSSMPATPSPSSIPAPAPTPVSTTFQGTIAGANRQTGTVTVQAQVATASSPSLLLRDLFVATLRAQSVTATGNFGAAGGTTVSLSGTYDTSTRALSLSGGGYAFTGTASGATIAGTYTGPSGAAGSFASRSTATGSVAVYCGNIFSSGDANDVTGVFNLVVSENSGGVSGAFYLNDHPFRNGPITGQVTGTSLSLTYTDRVSGQMGTATGTIQGGSVSGSSPAESGGTNPFSGSASRCQ